MKSALIASMVLMLHVAAYSGVFIGVTPPTVTHGTLDTLTLTVQIVGAENLVSSSITLEFNADVIKPVGFDKGEFFEGNPGGYEVHYASSPILPAVTASVTITQAILGSSSASGAGTLFSIRFAPLKGDETMVSVSSAELRNAANELIEYESSPSLVIINIAEVRARAMLEGAFNGVQMRTQITGILPLTQPFGGLPWYYDGPEILSPDFFAAHTDIVDWVLVDVRTDLSAASIVGRRAGLIKNTGAIVDTDGVSPLHVTAPNHMDYYIVVRHRNHLSVMSSDKVWLGFDEEVYDFSGSPSQAYGLNAMKLLAPGVYGLYAGEANGDGQISGTDFNLFMDGFFGIATGYVWPDFNLDGQVTGLDFNIFYDNYFNIRASRVPE